jgi:hypothetical protein
MRCLWATLTVWSIGLFRRAHTSFIPIRPTTALVVSGPIPVYTQPDVFGLCWLVPGFSAVVWRFLGVDSAVGCYRSRSILRYRPRGAVLENLEKSILSTKRACDGGLNTCEACASANHLALQLSTCRVVSLSNFCSNPAAFLRYTFDTRQ